MQWSHLGYSGKSEKECLCQEGTQHVQMPWTVSRTKDSASRLNRGREKEGVEHEMGEASVRLHGFYKIITQASPTKILIQLEEGLGKDIFKNLPGKAARVEIH